MKTKLIAIILAIIFAFVVTGCNKQIVDFKYQFNYAWIDIPGREPVQGKVQSWTDFEDGDQLQITIGGVTYLTNSSRCVLANK